MVKACHTIVMQAMKLVLGKVNVFTLLTRPQVPC